jgi:2-haloacid dehalogenase
MLDFAQFEVLSFDCYGTLIDWESGILSAIRPILANRGKDAADHQLLTIYSELESEAEQGSYRPYREVLESVVRGFGKHFGFSATSVEQRSLPESLAGWPPFPDTVSALKRLKTRYQLAVISNVDDDLFAATARRLEVPLDFVITAQQAGAYKPSLRTFNLAKERIGVEPHSWLHAAQSVYHDVIPARSLGISTVWVKRPQARPGSGAAKAASGQPDLEVPDLKTLAGMAEKKS